MRQRGPDYVWTRALRTKDEALLAINELHNELSAQGLEWKIAISDSGGEFDGSDADDLYRSLGMVHRPRASETHDERAERAVRAVKNGIRAALLRAKAPPSTWTDAMLTVTAGLQTVVHAKHNVCAHAALFRQQPDLTAIAPFYSVVYAFDGTRKNTSWNPKGIPARYLSPAPAYGVGSARVSVRGNPRVVRTVEYAGPPEAEIDAQS